MDELIQRGKKTGFRNGEEMLNAFCRHQSATARAAPVVA